VTSVQEVFLPRVLPPPSFSVGRLSFSFFPLLYNFQVPPFSAGPLARPFCCYQRHEYEVSPFSLSTTLRFSFPVSRLSLRLSFFSLSIRLLSFSYSCPNLRHIHFSWSPSFKLDFLPEFRLCKVPPPSPPGLFYQNRSGSPRLLSTRGESRKF